MFDLTFEFESLENDSCKFEIEQYLKQHINQDRFKAYKQAKELNSCFNIPDTAKIVFGGRFKKQVSRITYALKASETIYSKLGLESYKPDELTQIVCEELYDTFMSPTIRVVNDKVLFYLLLQFDSGFVRWCTNREEYKYLCEKFNSSYPTFNNADRLSKLQSFSGALV